MTLIVDGNFNLSQLAINSSQGTSESESKFSGSRAQGCLYRPNVERSDLLAFCGTIRPFFAENICCAQKPGPRPRSSPYSYNQLVKAVDVMAGLYKDPATLMALQFVRRQHVDRGAQVVDICFHEFDL